jgi:alcohol dehydrogenase
MVSVHLESGRVELRSSAAPGRLAGYALIRLLTGGICNTDLELQRRYYGFTGTPGHEFVGEVVDADSTEWIGRRVVGEINLACTECTWCKRGQGRHCPHRTVLGIVRHAGAFAEFLTLPERNLRLVPESVSTSRAVFTEPLAAACQILDQVAIPAGSSVAVLGDGKLGLLIAQVLQAHGARVLQFGRHAGKLAISARKGVAVEIAGGHLPEAEFRWVVDATGSPEGLRAAVRMTEPCGTVVMKSTVHGEVALDSAPMIVNEITLVGSRCGRFEPALALLQNDAVDVESMISECTRLSDAPLAFETAARKGVLKVLMNNE